jgi:hypothetical protein
MEVATYEGIVENGCVRLPAGVYLPDGTKVYVIVPGREARQTGHVRSPRLSDPSKADFFKLEVTEEGTDAPA